MRVPDLGGIDIEGSPRMPHRSACSSDESLFSRSRSNASSDTASKQIAGPPDATRHDGMGCLKIIRHRLLDDPEDIDFLLLQQEAVDIVHFHSEGNA